MPDDSASTSWGALQFTRELSSTTPSWPHNLKAVFVQVNQKPVRVIQWVQGVLAVRRSACD
jgi:hypothetical protein